MDQGGLSSFQLFSASLKILDLLLKMKVEVTQSCPTLCDPVDYTGCGILQARILGWTAFPFSSGSSWPRNWTRISCIADGFFTKWAVREALYLRWNLLKQLQPLCLQSVSICTCFPTLGSNVWTAFKIELVFYQVACTWILTCPKGLKNFSKPQWFPSPYLL